MWEKPWVRNAVLVGIAAVVIGILTFVAIRATDTSAAVEVYNDSECPEVTFSLADTRSGTILAEVILEPGESTKIDVDPDVEYVFTTVTESDPDERGKQCLDPDTGTISVPRGSTLTYRVVSQERPYVVFANNSDCPNAELTLRREDSDEEIRLLAEPGESIEEEVAPDQDYEYQLEYCGTMDQGTFNLGFNDSTSITAD